MNREQLSRFLSAALVPLGGLFLVLNVSTGDVLGTVLGTGIAILGAVLFWSVGRFPDAEFDLTETPAFVMNFVQLGAFLAIFALLTSLLSDLESVTRVFHTGIPSPKYPAYAGLSMGVFLGGGIPYLMHRLDPMRELTSDSIPARIVGFSITFGTFAILLVHQPPSSALYVTAYLFGRIGVLVGMYVPSRL